MQAKAAAMGVGMGGEMDESWRSASAAATYDMPDQSQNPFKDSAAPFEEGMRLFQEGASKIKILFDSNMTELFTYFCFFI